MTQNIVLLISYYYHYIYSARHKKWSFFFNSKKKLTHWTVYQIGNWNIFQCARVMDLFQKVVEALFLWLKFPLNSLKLSLTRETDPQKRLSNCSKFQFLTKPPITKLPSAKLPGAKFPTVNFTLQELKFCKIAQLFLRVISF